MPDVSSSPRAARPSATYPLVLLTAYTVFWLVLAIAPFDRHDWLLENALVAIALPLIIRGYRWQRLSDRAYTQLWLFMMLHAIGAHYTYAEVPYDSWLHALTGHRLADLLHLHRNHFDRLVHFLYGALLFRVFWELFAPRISGPLALRYLLVMTFIMSHAGIYEVIEWGAAEIFGGDLGVTYLGTQGDVWDAQKDMALAMSGTLLAALWMALMGAGRD